MTSSPSGGVFSACLLLVCGAPGSGKTLLAKTLAGGCGKAKSAWHWAVVHFDDFYPVDMRVKQVGHLFRIIARHNILTSAISPISGWGDSQ